MDQEARQELQQITMQLQQLQHYLQILEEQTQETAQALDSMEALQRIKPGTKAYVPLTNGIYVKATLDKTDEFLINTGNNTITAQAPKEAKKLLQEQQSELTSTQERLMEEFSKTYQRYLELQIRTQEEG